MTNEEIDKWLAEKVMKWIIIDDLHIKTTLGEYVLDGTQWHPTTDIAQAFMCVEKMREKGYYFTIYLLIEAGTEVTIFHPERYKSKCKHFLKNEVCTKYSTSLSIALCNVIYEALKENKWQK